MLMQLLQAYGNTTELGVRSNPGPVRRQYDILPVPREITSVVSPAPMSIPARRKVVIITAAAVFPRISRGILPFPLPCDRPTLVSWSGPSRG